ncbi:hypothetical protein AB0M02_08745 [Actinoplanes sp. NPDC051861]|uniref:hypothetical protein n=1 Tax=Actinoplanes sp. NPDC051861 TaxID=3155170 RepID=UPI00343B6014
MDVSIAVNNFGDTRSGGLAGPMGLFLIVLMCIATVLLIRNMNKRIRRLPDSFPSSAEQDPVVKIADTADASADGVEADRSVQAAPSAEAEVEAAKDPGRDAGAARD